MRAVDGASHGGARAAPTNPPCCELARVAAVVDDGGMRAPGLVVVCAVAVLAACSKSSAKPLAPGASHADSPEHPCTWFTAAEIGERIGGKVGPGRIAGPLGTSCQWNGTENPETSVQIQVVRDVSFWSAPTTAPGYAAIAGLGKAAYVVDQDGGAKASALLDAAFVTVLVAKVRDARAAAERLLADTLPRVR